MLMASDVISHAYGIKLPLKPHKVDLEGIMLSEISQQWVQSLSWEDPLQKDMATHPSVLAWEIPWTEEPGKLQPMGSQKSQI